jgi:hypothetical protein
VFGFRADADVVKDAPLTRRVLPLLMPTRAEALVYFDMDVDAAPIDATVAAWRAGGINASVLHVWVAAAVRVLHEHPRLNRFASGGRLYQRRGVWISFSGKTEKTTQGSLRAVKAQFDPTATPLQHAAVMETAIASVRDARKNTTERELSLLFRLPILMQQMLMSLLLIADRFGLLPRVMIDSDPMFASLFVANLGSLGMDAASHHLFEYGSIPLFCTIGQKRDSMGKQTYPFRFTFDERTEDGLYCYQAIQRMKELLAQRPSM